MSREDADKIVADVGHRIAEARRAKGWTQAEAAEKLGMEVQSVQRIERGTENLTIRSLVRIAGVLGVPTRSLLDEPVTRVKRVGRPRRA